MSSYAEVVSKDLELIWSVQEYCYRTPRLNNFMGAIVSKNPLKDIVVVLWIFFVIGLVELGRKHFWVVSMNLGAAFAARSLIEAKRPVEYDIRLQPTTDTRAESYGFPSLESYLSVVIMGHLFLSFKSLWLLPLGLLVVALIGFSRVYSRARFPHQVVGSWLCGLVGLTASMHCCEKMSIHTWSTHQHGACATFALLSMLCHLALSIENNESRLISLPKAEFVRVISELLGGSEQPSLVEADADDEGGEREEEFEFFDPTGQLPHLSARSSARSSRSQGRGGQGGQGQMRESPRTAATKQAQAGMGGMGQGQGQVRRRVKSDSLYFLQRSIEARESARESGSRENTTRTSEYTSARDEEFNPEAGYKRY